MAKSPLGLAVVTGASTGIGYELAKQCAAAGFDLLVAADGRSNRQRMISAPRASRSRRSRRISPPSKESTNFMPQSAGGRWQLFWRMPAEALAKPFLTSSSGTFAA